MPYDVLYRGYVVWSQPILTHYKRGALVNGHNSKNGIFGTDVVEREGIRNRKKVVYDHYYKHAHLMHMYYNKIEYREWTV